MPGIPSGTGPESTSSAPYALEPAWVGDVLRFWFEDVAPTDWFRKNEALDARIRDRFGVLHARLLAEDGGARPQTPRTMLAAVIVLDQFSRHLFRDGPSAYASDPLARRLARSAIDMGFDAALTVDEKQFLYLPFEHSEDAGDQRMAVGLIATLGDAEASRYAIAHQDIIERFGRFPHRNAILGRPSTPEEIAFLQSPMSSF